MAICHSKIDSIEEIRYNRDYTMSCQAGASAAHGICSCAGELIVRAQRHFILLLFFSERDKKKKKEIQNRRTKSLL